MSVRRALLAAVPCRLARRRLAAAPVPKEQLLKPPADADHYRGRVRRRQAWRHVALDAARRAHRLSPFAIAARLDHRDRPGDDARRRRPAGKRRRARRSRPSGDAAETFAIAGRQGALDEHRRQRVDRGPSGYYLPAGGVGLSNEVLVDRLVAAGGKGIDLLPSGHATLTIGPSLTIQGPGGPEDGQAGVRARHPVVADHRSGSTSRTNISPTSAGSRRMPAGYRGAMPRRCATSRTRPPPPRSRRSRSAS